ncbi:7-carboxy-7-deazaguanine synthase QueE [Aurantiacibacter poecillastricola]|uniref:7-carboxy-7-deazaguanine synthase QueE n=1 Tax=Aurantiacibacter poecillastricola TaxID=3064385 RepID=UPI00273E7B34|nr:7-carboxy-7-deazaguanine synthase QueE [Aurantiacibacter sp. 219JJ12-13]MDP5262789.1 7-carboxy-7-deazaguanine synthase QueE [Aurantiacibacter sp. 219JJ12-13]
MPLTLATQAPDEPEIFASLQGEGPSAGMPVAFLRLSRCNLACVWCDTAYTWHFEGDERPHRSGETYERRPNQLVLNEAEVARRIAETGQKRLVITGGEPLMQAGKLAEMLEHLPDMQVEIETNGTVDPPARLDIRVDQYNVSPKLAHSGNPAELALKPEMLDRWATDERAFFKFVLAAPGDIEEVRALAQTYMIPARRIFLMPEGTDGATLRSRMEWLVPLCLEHGFRLSDRLHIHLFGDTRGT